MSLMNEKAYTFPAAFRSPDSLSGLDKGSSVLVGFSGGADSTALLHILCSWAKSTGAKIYAAHVNHGIRGDEADRDELFCKRFAESLGVEFFSIKLDVPAIAKESGESIETAARNKRYEYFDALMKAHDIPLLATAHNADDNLETIIFNLCRGAGLSGMCGIPNARPCSFGTVVRPILAMEKSEIIKYCVDNGLDFVTDSTNADTDYTRNKIRNEILPILKQINSGAIKNAYRMSETLRADALCIENVTEQFIDSLENTCAINLDTLCNSPTPIVSRALMKIYSDLSSGRALESVHIEALISLAKKGVPHSSASLPENIIGVIENGCLCLKKKEEKAEIEEYSVVLSAGENTILQTNSKIVIQNSHSEKIVYKNSILTSIDCDNINGTLTARSRRAGDKIRMGGMNKSIKKLMCDKKIPLELRARLPIICDEKGILAVPLIGTRDGAKYTAKDGQKALEIYFFPL